MIAKNLQRPITIALLLATPAAYAVEISHTVHTQLCGPAGKVIGTCVTSHNDNGLLDPEFLTLEFECELRRLGVLVDEIKVTYDDLEGNGQFTGVVDEWTYGLGSIGYCAKNKSKYWYYFVPVTGQSSDQDCVMYTKGPGNPQ